MDSKADSNNNVEDSESINSDESEEMTEVDEDECDLIKAKYLAHMKELETHFSRLKDELISQRFKEVDQKLKEIEEESADEFRNPLKKLEMNMQFKTNFSTLMKDYRLKNIDHIYECEMESDKLTLENNIHSLIDKHITNIENEILHLEESRRQFQHDYSIYKLNEQSLGTQANEKGGTNNGSSVILTGTPYVVYTLPENEMLEDLSMIKMHNNLSNLFNSES